MEEGEEEIDEKRWIYRSKLYKHSVVVHICTVVVYKKVLGDSYEDLLKVAAVGSHQY